MNTIKTNCTDAELSAAICDAYKLGIYHAATKEEVERGSYYNWEPDFASNANLAIGLLSKQKGVTVDFNREWQVCVLADVAGNDWHDSESPVFARAACFSLLKAKGWTVEDAS